MSHDDGLELFPTVDKTGRKTGRATRQECHSGSFLLHPVVHLHIFDHLGRLYLQKRPAWKDIQPGLWDTSVGGHVRVNETVIAALRREAYEELGISHFRKESLGTYVFTSDRESELVYAFRTLLPATLLRPSAELAGGQFFTWKRIRDAIGTGIFTANLEGEILRFFSYLLQD